MKQMRNRILSLLAASALAVCPMQGDTLFLLRTALTVSAEVTANPADEFETAHIGTGVQITGWNGSGSTVVIPSKIGGLPVDEICGSAFSGKSLLTEVTVPDSVAVIGSNAFSGCVMLSKITLPEHLESIGTGAFRNCMELKEIRIPDGVERIETNTFSDCAGLKKVFLPDSVTSIAKYAFRSCTALTEINLPDSLAELEESAFCFCSSLKKIVFPDGPETIGDYAFANCSALTDITLPKNLNRIGIGAFVRCSSLSSVTIPDGTEYIDSDAFRDTALTDILIPASVYGIGGNAFSVANLISNLIMYGVSGSEAESYAKRYDYITFAAISTAGTAGTGETGDGSCSWALDGGRLTVFGTGKMPDFIPQEPAPWYPDRDKIRSIVVKEGVTSIGDYAFYDCAKLSEVTLPDTLTEIGNGSFMLCRDQLDHILLPEGLTSIGDMAFELCQKLSSIRIPQSVTHFGKDAFDYTGWLDSCRETDGPLVIVNCIVIDGVCCSGKVTIPSGVRAVSSWAFKGNTAMTEVVIPAGVTEIDPTAFEECTALESFDVASDNPDYSSRIALYNKNGTELIQFPCGSQNVTEYTVGANVTKIDECAFSYCRNLTDLTILNPDCEICESLYGISLGPDGSEFSGTIHGYAYSTAHMYALKYKCGFQELSDSPVQTTSAPAESTHFGETVTTAAAGIIGSCGENLTWTLDDDGTLTISGTGDMEDFSGGIPTWDAYQNEIRRVVIGDGVTGIGAYSFNGYETLADISVPASVQRIGIHAFTKTAWLSARQQENPLVVVNHILISGNSTGERELTVPDGVTYINDSAFRQSKALTKIVLPDSVTGIGGDAFYNCASLQSVTLPDSLTEIGDSAFRMCYSLKEIVLPDSVTSIGRRAFMECTDLQSITIPESVTQIGEDAFADCAGLTVKSPAGSYAESYAAEHGIRFEAIGAETRPVSGSCGENLTWALSIDGTLRISGKGAMTDYDESGSPFAERSDIRRVVIGDGVTGIGAAAFSGCESLTGISLPDGITAIGKYAFGGCAALTAVTIPDSVKSIGEYAFASTGLTEITIPESVRRIDGAAFSGCTALTDVTLSAGITDIPFSMFRGCSSLTGITIPDSVRTISENAFYGCDSLTIRGTEGSYAESYANENNIPFETVTLEFTHDGVKYLIQGDHIIVTGYTEELPYALEIPAAILGKPVTSFQQFAFAACDKLYYVTIPDTVTEIGMQAFWGCENLLKVTLPSTLNSLYEAAFAQCVALKSVTIPDGCKTIGNLVFSGCSSLSEVHIPASVTEFGEPAFIGTPWLEAKRKENPLVIENGILLDGMTVYGDITIPDSVRMIAPFAFSWEDNNARKNLRSVNIPDSVTVIGGGAFDGCKKLETVTLPDSPIRIGDGAFMATPWFEELRAQEPVIIAAYDVLFVPFAEGAVALPDGVRYISPWAFTRHDRITEVTLPESVAEIGQGAFSECSALTSLTVRNPDCLFLKGETIVSSGYDEHWDPVFNGVIRGYDDSTAEQYAKENGYQFESLGKAPETLCGDYDGDSTISAFDAKLLARLTAEDTVLTEQELSSLLRAVPDHDGDGLVTLLDVCSLLKALKTA